MFASAVNGACYRLKGCIFFTRFHVFRGFDAEYIGFAFYVTFFRDAIKPLEIEIKNGYFRRFR